MNAQRKKLNKLIAVKRSGVGGKKSERNRKWKGVRRRTEEGEKEIKGEMEQMVNGPL